MAKTGWMLAASVLALLGPDAMAQAPPRTGGGFAGFGGRMSKAAKDPSAWIVYESADGGFSILLPGKPKVASKPGKLFTTHIVRWDERNAKYSITYFDPPPASLKPEVVEATMKRDRDLAIRDVKGSLKQEKPISIHKAGEDWPGLASVIEDRSHLWTSRLYAVEGRMYALQVGYPKGQDRGDDASKFFESFVVRETARR